MEEHRTSWARVMLRQGRSEGAVWEISSAYPEARLTVGSSRVAGWMIEAIGVAPTHCEFFWDGSALWVADTQNAGGVFLDGRRVTDWSQIRGPAEVRFGQAAFDIETSQVAERTMLSSPNHAKPLSISELLVEELTSGAVFGGAAREDDSDEFPGEATRVAASFDPPGETTRIADIPTGIRVLRAPGRSAGVDRSLAPHLGGNPMTSRDPGGLKAEATRMSSMNGDFSTVTDPTVSSPPHRAFPERPSAAPPPPPPGGRRYSSAPPPPPRYSSPSVPPPSYGSVPPPPPRQSTAPVVPNEVRRHSQSPNFAAPPVTDPGRAAASDVNVLDRIKNVLRHEPSEKTGDKHGEQSLPPRTWGLLIITVLAAAGLLMMEGPTPEAPATTTNTPVATTQATNTQATNTQATNTQATNTQATATTITGTPQVAEPATDTQTAVPRGLPAETSNTSTNDSEASDDGEGPTLARQAADQFALGNHTEALNLYRQLSQAQPNETVYSTMVMQLERIIRSRCVNGVGPGGQPCAP